ncbi:MAG: RNA 2',3'-cyclic phosphodiesterase [Thermoanaerobaculia bacterium]
MPLPSAKLRLFIASDLPEPLRAALGERAANLRRALPSASWGHPDTYHVTYAFLGDQEESAVARLGDALEEALATVHATDARIGAAGFFPDARRPRVGWVGLQPSEAIAGIAAATRGAVRAAGVAMDEKPFTPHLTLARMKAPWKHDDTEAFTTAFAAIALASRIESVSLYMSRLTTDGAQHTPLRTVRLRSDDLSRPE